MLTKRGNMIKDKSLKLRANKCFIDQWIIVFPTYPLLYNKRILPSKPMEIRKENNLNPKEIMKEDILREIGKRVLIPVEIRFLPQREIGKRILILRKYES